MNEILSNNKVIVTGEVYSELKYSHETYGEKFFECELKVERLSSSADFIPITISEKLLLKYNIVKGSKLVLEGQFRSYNKLIENKSRLMLTIFVKDILVEEKDNPNVIELIGYVCKEPIFRVTPFKREITDVLVAVNRGYNKSDYLPCIAWGRNARLVKDLKVGDKICIQGRIQSRDYQKKLDTDVITKRAYEVSIGQVFLVGENELEYNKSHFSAVSVM